jgi:hypothetical protein
MKVAGRDATRYVEGGDRLRNGRMVDYEIPREILDSFIFSRGIPMTISNTIAQ